MVKGMRDGDIACKAPRKAKPGEVVSRYEAPRGENIHYIKAKGSEKPEQLKVRAPTLGNYPATIEMLKKVDDANLPERVGQEARREIERLRMLSPASSEYQVIRTYLDWILSLFAERAYAAIGRPSRDGPTEHTDRQGITNDPRSPVHLCYWCIGDLSPDGWVMSRLTITLTDARHRP